ncbi:protein LEAD-SENSITIVE 1-like [Magnolia sinica]|uniref:protein LEAD-SENSITIVE 1-like n=1 Tax=Magnolia sinica TaxID=86752 RepID=UPI0026580597|nr:protein LEAD-SENSITIVE 1-like [Magnolia sinica]
MGGPASTRDRETPGVGLTVTWGQQEPLNPFNPNPGEKISKEQLKPGIYMGDNKVIHFNAATGQKIESGGFYRHCDKSGAGKSKTSNGLTLSCLDCFLDGDQLYIYEYSVSWIPFVYGVGGKTCSMAKSDLPEVVLRRANEWLNNGFGQYNFILNNCESFAFYCKTGRAEAPCCSGQTINLIGDIANGETQSFIPGTVIGLVGEVMRTA